MMNLAKTGDLKMNILTKTDIAMEWYKTSNSDTLEQYIRDNFTAVHAVNENSFMSYIIGYERTTGVG